MKHTVQLTDLEAGVILDALNAFYHQADGQLRGKGVIQKNGDKRPLGYIEETLLKQRKELVLPLLGKFERLY